MECPKCHAECRCDSVHNGVALIYGPYGCPNCHWSENDEYDLSNGKSPVDERGGTIDQYGGYQPLRIAQPERCNGCNGDGDIERPAPQRDDPNYARVVKCSDCDGNGWV